MKINTCYVIASKKAVCPRCQGDERLYFIGTEYNECSTGVSPLWGDRRERAFLFTSQAAAILEMNNIEEAGCDVIRDGYATGMQILAVSHDEIWHDALKHDNEADPVPRHYVDPPTRWEMLRFYWNGTVPFRFPSRWEMYGAQYHDASRAGCSRPEDNDEF